MNVPEKLRHCWNTLGQMRPLVYHVTNFVAASFQADICLAIGASPVMSPSEKEAAELVRVADSVLINIGTPTEASIKTIHAAMGTAGVTGKPVVLDPVGYGATEKRTSLVDDIMKRYAVSIIKGNASEIALMAGCQGTTRGVDATGTCRADTAAFKLAQKYGTIVVATGRTNYVSDGNRVFEIHGGSDMMERITAGGCGVGSVITAVLGASGDVLASAIAGLIAMDMAAEKALEAGPGSFKVSLIDHLYGLSRTGLGDLEGRLTLQDRIVG